MERVLYAPREPLPPGPDAATDVERYRAWVEGRQAERLSGSGPAVPEGAPPVGVILLAGGIRADLLEASVASVLAQTWNHWRLAVMVTGRPDTPTDGVLDRASRVAPGRVRWEEVAPGASAAVALRAGVVGADSPAMLWMGAGDRLAPDALALLATALGADRAGSGPDVVYADEDREGEDGQLHHPCLKPDWTPDLLLSTPYLGRPLLVRRHVLDRAGGVHDLPGGDWEHDLQLRLTEAAGRIEHVAEVLCHRRGHDAPGTATGPRTGAGPGTAGGAVTAALARRGEDATVAPGPLPGTWYVRRRPPTEARVTAVIPFRDGATLLRAAMDSIDATRGGMALETVLVDNGSVEPETETLLERLATRPGVTVVRDDRPFNWAALNNVAAGGTGGDVLLFLNNDVEALRAGWLQALVAQALRPEVGAVGARLLYPTGRVQHAGVVVGMGGAAGHVLAGLPAASPGYLGMAVLTRGCSAVTGACLATRRDVFEALDGFDESLGMDLNDVDYCLRAWDHRWRVVYEPLAELVHHESPSRGTSGSVADISRFIDRWEEAIRHGDRHLNQHLTRVDSSCALRGSGEEGWWREWRSNLGTS